MPSSGQYSSPYYFSHPWESPLPEGFYRDRSLNAIPYGNTQYLAPNPKFDPYTGALSYYIPAMSNVSNVLGLGEHELGSYMQPNYTTAAGQPSPAQMYTQPPAGNRLLDTLGALQGMAGRQTGGFGAQESLNLAHPAIQGLGAADFLNLVLQEPGRINQLLQTLLGGYQTAGSLFGEQASAKAQAKQIKIGKQQGRASILSSAPIVGGLLAGTIA